MKILTCIFLGVFVMSLAVVSIKGADTTIWALPLGIAAGIGMLIFWDVYSSPNLVIKDHGHKNARGR